MNISKTLGAIVIFCGLVTSVSGSDFCRCPDPMDDAACGTQCAGEKPGTIIISLSNGGKKSPDILKIPNNASLWAVELKEINKSLEDQLETENTGPVFLGTEKIDEIKLENMKQYIEQQQILMENLEQFIEREQARQ